MGQSRSAFLAPTRGWVARPMVPPSHRTHGSMRTPTNSFGRSADLIIPLVLHPHLSAFIRSPQRETQTLIILEGGRQCLESSIV